MEHFFNKLTNCGIFSLFSLPGIVRLSFLDLVTLCGDLCVTTQADGAGNVPETDLSRPTRVLMRDLLQRTGSQNSTPQLQDSEDVRQICDRVLRQYAVILGREEAGDLTFDHDTVLSALACQPQLRHAHRNIKPYCDQIWDKMIVHMTRLGFDMTELPEKYH